MENNQGSNPFDNPSPPEGDGDKKKKLSIILGSLAAVLVISGGLFAFGGNGEKTVPRTPVSQTGDVESVDFGNDSPSTGKESAYNKKIQKEYEKKRKADEEKRLALEKEKGKDKEFLIIDTPSKKPSKGEASNNDGTGANGGPVTKPNPGGNDGGTNGGTSGNNGSDNGGSSNGGSNNGNNGGSNGGSNNGGTSGGSNGGGDKPKPTNPTKPTKPTDGGGDKPKPTVPSNGNSFESPNNFGNYDIVPGNVIPLDTNLSTKKVTDRTIISNAGGVQQVGTYYGPKYRVALVDFAQSASRETAVFDIMNVSDSTLHITDYNFRWNAGAESMDASYVDGGPYDLKPKEVRRITVVSTDPKVSTWVELKLSKDEPIITYRMPDYKDNIKDVKPLDSDTRSTNSIFISGEMGEPIGGSRFKAQSQGIYLLKDLTVGNVSVSRPSQIGFMKVKIANTSKKDMHVKSLKFYGYKGDEDVYSKAFDLDEWKDIPNALPKTIKAGEIEEGYIPFVIHDSSIDNSVELFFEKEGSSPYGIAFASIQTYSPLKSIK